MPVVAQADLGLTFTRLVIQMGRHTNECKTGIKGKNTGESHGGIG